MNTMLFQLIPYQIYGLNFRALFLLVGNEDSTTITIAPTQSIEIPMDPQDPNSTLVLVAPGSAHTVVLHRITNTSHWNINW